MSADRGWRNNNFIPRLTHGHKAIKVRNRTRRHANFNKFCIEDFSTKFGRKQLLFLLLLQSPFHIYRLGSQVRDGNQYQMTKVFCLGVHHIGSWIKVKTLLFMNVLIFLSQTVNFINQFGRYMRSQSVTLFSEPTAHSFHEPNFCVVTSCHVSLDEDNSKKPSTTT